jgi:hypothetical protein
VGALAAAGLRQGLTLMLFRQMRFEALVAAAFAVP